MKPQEIMQAQIDSALAGLTRIREGLAGSGSAETSDLIGHDLEWVASHLEDIRHIWSSLKANAAARAPGRPALLTAVRSAGGS